MAYLKALVSKKRRRFQEEGFDLDLTYIKPNIVAMGFPSDNLEGVYRNHIEEVIRFLETRHKNHYKVYNLCSERYYDHAKFNNRVATFPFDDHNPPPFELIEPFCDDVDGFLSGNEKNVAFIHCKDGKGRTGVMICAYLLHNANFTYGKEALKYYGDARTRNAKGVTIPSQRRYVLYYNHLLQHKLEYTRTMVLLKKFEMLSDHMFQNFTFNPYYIIWQQRVMLYQSEVYEGKKTVKGFSFALSQPIPLCGDIRVEFFHKDMFRKERLFQFWFNTFFISQAAETEKIFEDEPTLHTFELDPELRYFDIGKEDLDKAHKDVQEKIYSSDFKVRVVFSEVGITPAASSASLPRKQVAKPKHKKSRSMDTIEADDILSNDYEEDDFSDTDSEYEWENEGQLGPQTTQLGPQTTENLRATDDILSSEPEGDDFSVTDDEIEWKKEKQLGPQRTGEVVGDQRQLPEERKEGEKEVPPEIRARGRLALEAYNKALVEGTTYDKRVPIMLIGQDRSGKTSLKNSLRGKRFNRDEVRTVGIDVDPSHFEVSTELWKAGEKNEVTDSDTVLSCEHHAGRLAAKMLRQEDKVPEEKIRREPTLSGNDRLVDRAASNVNSDYTLIPSHISRTGNHNSVKLSGNFTNPKSNGMPIDTEPAQTSNIQKRKDEYSLDASAYDKSNVTKWQEKKVSPLVTPIMPEEIAMFIERLLKEVNDEEDKEEIYSVLWDFGGQSVYYATHPIFLTARAMYFLVYDLSRNPDEGAEPVVKQGMFTRYEDSFDKKTNLDYLDFWMTSVASFGTQNGNHEICINSEVLPEKLPPVFLVCSHADDPYGGGDPSIKAQKIFDSLQSKSYKTHLYDGVFAVDNTKSGDDTAECPEVTRLRREVLAVAKELPQMKEAIPIKWLKYEKALQVTREQGRKWITLENAKQIASKVCNVVDDQQFQTLLNFFHDQRILIHFDDTPELNKLVILDPQWLIDVFKKVITIAPKGSQEKEFKELWFKLETTGILVDKLLKHLWGPLFENKETSENLIAIMEKFSLLCPWPSSDSSCGKQYLVPSMLMSHPPEDIKRLVASAQIPSLFIKFESGQVPPGLFPRLVLQFFKWGREEFLSPQNPHLFYNFARFYRSGNEDCSVIFLCHSSSIEVVHHRATNEDLGLADSLQSKMNLSADMPHGTCDVTCTRTLCRQVGLMLESMRREFCWLKNMKYDLCVMCPVCCPGGGLYFCFIHHKKGCKQEECLHFWSESELRSAKHNVACTKNAAALNNKLQVQQLAPWFAPLTEQLADDERDIGQSEVGSGKKSLALSGKVVKSLMSQSCGPEEVVHQVKETLQLDQASLEHPEPGAKRLIRCLARKAKCYDRVDVVKHLRDITPAGTTGPLMPEQLDVRKIPFSRRRELTIDLSSGDEWKLVAERLGMSQREIRFLDNRTLNPFDSVLGFIANQRYTSVGSLYDVLDECGLPLIADLL